jgi:2-polyprenyl-3-methyl-5-hydroxy-6-metoxy-1,4-benzoquinol methylase
MTHKQFLKRTTEDTHYLDADTVDYVTTHSRRLYYTYKACLGYLKPGDKVLSLGAGPASIEKLLVEKGIEVTILDFPEFIDNQRDYFEQLGLKAFGANLMTDELNFLDKYDMVLYSEIMEHLPIAPHKQLQRIKDYIKIGGHMLVTTPNLGSFIHITRLLLMIPILPEADKTFGEVNVENQGVHRREYLPCEIKDEFKKINFSVAKVKYFFYTYPSKIGTKLLHIPGYFISRFRPGMLIVGKRDI